MLGHSDTAAIYDGTAKGEAKLPPSVALAIVALILFSLILSLNLNPTSDITWRFHVAHSTLAGKEIYRDLIETNPPLWFWASLLWTQIATPLGVSAYAIMCVGIHALAALAVFLLDQLIGKMLKQKERCALLIGFVVAYLYVPIGEIGQREQALIVGGTLWIALANRRLEQLTTPVWLIVLVAGFGAYAFALKHYFVAIPIGIEIWLLASLKRHYRPFRLETIILAVAALCYAAAVFALAPLFLSRIVPLVFVAYESYGAGMGFKFEDRLFSFTVLTSFSVVPIIAWLLVKPRPRIVIGLFIFLIITTIIFCLQFKGWRYHQLAAHGAAFLLISLALGSALEMGRLRDNEKAAIALICFAYVSGTLILQPVIPIIQNDGQTVSKDLRQLVFSEPQSKRIAILSVAPEHAFYLLDRAKRPQWSRHYGLWMLPGLQTPVANPEDESVRIAEFDRVRREFISDITCAPPDIVVSEAGTMTVLEPISIDTMGYLQQDTRFREWFDTYYQEAEKFEIFTVWRLRRDRPKAGDCLRDP